MDDGKSEKKMSTTERERDEEKEREREREREKERGVLPIVPSESLLMQRCCGDRLTGFYDYSNMASSWSARSSNMLPMSSRMLTVVFCSATELHHTHTHKHTHTHTHTMAF